LLRVYKFYFGLNDARPVAPAKIKILAVGDDRIQKNKSALFLDLREVPAQGICPDAASKSCRHLLPANVGFLTHGPWLEKKIAGRG